MYNSSIIYLERSRIFHRLTFLRRMGGGPRTFPGGLNKWQWKRLHENQARQKEKRLLDQEKQLYQARVRSEIRSKLSDPNQTTHEQGNLKTPNYKPLSPKEHIKTLADRFMEEGIKTLADRFMEEGAEDLWNEADGPIESPSLQEMRRIESNHNPINLQKMVSGQLRITSNQVSDISSGYNQLKPRSYSTFSCLDSRYSLLKVRHYSVRTSYRKNDNHSSDECSDDEEGFLMTKTRGARLSLIGSSDDEESDDGKGDVKKKVMMSSAALRKYDKKVTKRVPLKFLEEEDDLSLHVQAIRNEVNKRRMAEKDIETGDDDSILSPKRIRANDQGSRCYNIYLP